MRDLPSSVSALVFQQLIKMEEVAQMRVSSTSHLESCLTAGFMSGMGSDRYYDAKKALVACSKGARRGITGLRAIIYRLAKVTAGATLEADMEKTLEWCAARGSLAAMEDLRARYPETADRATTFLQRHTCGIGADFFCKVTGPFNYGQLSNLAAIETHLQRTNQDPGDIVVNARGDTLIHATASGGSLDIVITLLDRYNVPVNLHNPQDETPLLCAMRAGHVDVVRSLLDRNADAKLTSTRGESVLHWLISVPDAAVQELLPRLITQGAEIHNPRWAQSCEYAAAMISGYIDRWDHPGSGTPLHWAVSRKRSGLVQQLLSHGAKHDDIGGFKTNLSAIEQAAYFHDHEILRLIINTRFPGPRIPCFDCGEDGKVLTMKSEEIPGGSVLRGLGRLIRNAIDGSDRYLMAVRWGAGYKHQLRETFKLLGEELSHQRLIRGVDLEGRSPLQYAARLGFHEAAECIYDFMDGASQIDVPYRRDGGITPLFEAVKRDNRTLFDFLLAKGARVDIRIDSPGMHDRFDWCILHTVAQTSPPDDTELANKLLDLGVPADGYDAQGPDPTETPLAVAIAHNNFRLADVLRERGADINALSRYTLSSRLVLEYPMTVLGRVVASVLRDCKPRLKYLLEPAKEQQQQHLASPTFVVAPANGLTALHVSALGLQARAAEFRQEIGGLVYQEILGYLLNHYKDEELVNAPTDDAAGTTALHIAVQTSNLDAVGLLLLEGESVKLDARTAAEGLTVLELARNRVQELDHWQHEGLGTAQMILGMLVDKERYLETNSGW